MFENQCALSIDNSTCNPSEIPHYEIAYLMSNLKVTFIHFKSVDSTNQWVRTHAQQLPVKGFTCVSASTQTAGRGRFKRTWISPRGGNIYASLFFTLPVEAQFFFNMGQLMAHSCVECLNSYHLPAQMKWPNDILINKKKVGGILTETFFIQRKVGVIIGIGINIDTREEVLASIDQPATSLLSFSGKKWNKKILLRRLLRRFFENYHLTMGGIEQRMASGFPPDRKPN